MAEALEPLRVTIKGPLGKMSGERIDPKDPHYWRRIILALAQLGYGNYQEAAKADIVEAAILLGLQRDIHKLAHEWTVYGRQPT